MKPTVKTLEFPLSESVPDSWFETVKRVWNQAVFYLLWRQHYKRAITSDALDLPNTVIEYSKLGNDWVMSCPIGKDFRIDKTKSWDEPGNVEFRFCCQLVKPLWLTEPPISVEGKISAIELRKPFAQKRCEWLKDASIPQVLVNDFIGLTVIPAWEAYQKGERGKPKFKGERDSIGTLPCASFRGQCDVIGGDELRLPGLGKVDVWGYNRRMGQPIAAMAERFKQDPESSPELIAKADDYMLNDIRKAIKSDGIDLKALDEQTKAETIAAYKDSLDRDTYLAKAIDYFSSPGSFRLIRRDGRYYIQISAYLPTTATPSSKVAAVDSGLDLLAHTNSGLKVEHEDLSKLNARVERLQQIRSEKQFGSNNYNKLSAKIKALQGRIKRNRRAHQTYWATQIADVNGEVKLKLIEPKECIDVPLPRPSEDGDKYLPNGRGEARTKNKTLADKALGQFSSKLESQCKKRDRKFSKVNVDPQSGVVDILLEQSDSAVSTQAQIAPASMGRESGNASHRRGKVTTPPINQQPKSQQAPELVSLANTPEPRKRPRRNRKREKAIG